MDNTTSSNTTEPSAAAAPVTQAHSAIDSVSADAKAALPVVDSLIKRVTQSAHDVVDNLAAKVSSVTDGLQDGVDKVGDTRDEWVESARDVIRQHPFAAVAGAVIIGAALLSLRSSRRD